MNHLKQARLTDNERAPRLPLGYRQNRSQVLVEEGQAAIVRDLFRDATEDGR